ncbi:MAG: hypothetical protein H3Z52_10925 [archaeon]|nr:hypothetical protein [archaeon]MCP8321433.1 hypothetical protein [archaeon]
MSRDELVEVTYDAAHFLNRIKVKYDLIDSHTAEEIDTQIRSARITLQRMDEIMKIDDLNLRTQELKNLKNQIEKANQRSLCSEDELLKWPLH